jgi:nucleotide-binding universal stress UspA family protein
MTPRKAKAIQPQTSMRAKYLVFIDDNEHSRVALRYACRKARLKGQPVEMLFVINPTDYNSIFAVSDVMRKERREEVEKVLTKMAEEAKDWSGIIPSLNIREGSVAEEIVGCIEQDNDIGMLFISSDPAVASGGVKLLSSLLGQLDEKLHLPMLVVPAHLTDQQIEELI